MCGIIGYAGVSEAMPILLGGLNALSYRGYDSAGVSVAGKNIQTIKAKGEIKNLENKLGGNIYEGYNLGIGHTRWATHGKPSDTNSHPHNTKNLTLVHNGIIENYRELGAMLEEKGYSFESETDTEIFASLIDLYYKELGDPAQAIYRAMDDVSGSFAICAMFRDQGDTIYSIRRDNPLVFAETGNSSFVASDLTAIVKYANEYCRPENNVLCVLKSSGIAFFNRDGEAVEVSRQKIEWDHMQAERGGFDHFMLKEIHEEPETLRLTANTYIKNSRPSFASKLLTREKINSLERIHIVACGTAMHAGMIGKSMIEAFAKIPVEVEIASEFRYKNPILHKNELVIVISQSGETADTLAALRYAKNAGLPVLSIVNVVGSTVASEADDVIYTYAGPEIAVASTKAYIVQNVVMYLLAIHLAFEKGEIDEALACSMCDSLQNRCAEAVEKAIALSSDAQNFARDIYKATSLFYIGRCIDYSMCLEASLKLKEISYIHSEALAAGELKHGTISLITENTPVIALITDRNICAKTISNIKEVSARHANVLVICTEEIDREFNIECNKKIVLPQVDENFAVFPASSIMQLIAYYTAVECGNDVDKPRNLAKSVTVE